MLRFQFNWKHQQSVVVEGERVDLAGGRITVVDARGQARVTFDEGELSSWWRVRGPVQPRRTTDTAVIKPEGHLVAWRTRL
jgi:hypothetical protein